MAVTIPHIWPEHSGNNIIGIKTMRVSSWPFATLVFGALSSSALAESVSHFEDCHVAVESKHTAVPRMIFADATARHYSSIIREAAKGPINFAGHYVLASWGCGAGCVMAAAIDKNSGRVTSLPFTVSDWPPDITEPLSYRADSCLLIAHGSRNESAEHGTYYYSFDGKAFTLRANTTNAGR
ncbi:hypothetical protein LJ655_13605 [Paraburkholderia sp. MMS20-SJTN17]|uniref:Lipoprotein n=1 Tax=Paraburkholderia translucens TaxID=2886945 RepID=A0ABS8KEM4_9BURK|nr:hypothetical protein [Paraburkholderia sp. MMS20-SJTN17]MCC8402908.1 hypothetical protein [Paraburkholderia sp. MMS20-SJTN17]